MIAVPVATSALPAFESSCLTPECCGCIRELNPRLGALDCKHWLELYPGLIGWLVLDLGMAAQQLQSLGRVQVMSCMTKQCQCVKDLQFASEVEPSS